jgi:hypothetical protein
MAAFFASSQLFASIKLFLGKDKFAFIQVAIHDDPVTFTEGTFQDLHGKLILHVSLDRPF